jgi:hypothetical protein
MALLSLRGGTANHYYVYKIGSKEAICQGTTCYDSFPGRPDKAGAKMDNNCCRASLDREHVGSLSLDQWVEGGQVK